MKHIIASLLLLLGSSAFAQLQLDGQATQGGWMMAHETDAKQKIVSATLDGASLKISSAGYIVFGFGRDVQPHHELTVKYESGEEKKYPIELMPRTYAIQRVEGIEPRIMEPSPEDLKRIEKETVKIAESRKEISDQENFHQTFIWPAKGPISGVYGSQRFYNGVGKNPHMGLDIAAPRGSLIVAPAGGRVVLAEPDLFYSGGTVILDHGLGIFSSFLHMDSINVKVGDILKQGDAIGRVGSKGRASGPHLHWGMNWQEVRIDPRLWLKDENKKNTEEQKKKLNLNKDASKE